MTHRTPAAVLAALAVRDLAAFLAPQTDRYGNPVVLSDGSPKGTQQGCWDRMGVFGRHGGAVRLAVHLKEADAWIVRYGTRQPPVFDLHAVKSALALVATCRNASDLDAAAELFNADWPAGWPRSVEMKWDVAFRKAA